MDFRVVRPVMAPTFFKMDCWTLSFSLRDSVEEGMIWGCCATCEFGIGCDDAIGWEGGGRASELGIDWEVDMVCDECGMAGGEPSYAKGWLN